MAFQPEYCPNPVCEHHKPGSFPWRRRGRYFRLCDGRYVQRFICLGCRKRFSTQTFRLDYRLKLPRLQTRVFEHLVSKTTLRQMARVLRVKRKTIEHRLDLIGEHCRRFHTERLARVAGKLVGEWSLDELETYETHRKLKPVTAAVLIERVSGFVLHSASGPLPARGRLTPAERRQLAVIEEREGKRRSGSRAAVDESFGVLAQCARPDGKVFVVTDLKQSYGASLRRKFGGRVAHARVSSKRKRDTRNPLFRVNHTLAMLRDGVSRLVRETWAASKIIPRLVKHVWIWICFRNYIRPMTNAEDRIGGITSAMRLGVEDHRWSGVELLRWKVAPRAVA